MPVRLRLLLLVFSVLVPAVLACGAAALFAYTHERQRAEDNLLRAARAVAQSLDREFDTMIRRLAVLAAAPSLHHDDLAAFWAEARSAATDPGTWIVLAGRDGRQLVNTLRPYGTPLPAPPPDHPVMAVIEGSFQSARPAVSNLFLGPVTGKPTLAVTVPVVDGAGRVLYCLAMGMLPAEALHDLVSGIGLPDEWLAAAFDAERVIVARSRQPESFVGTRPVPALLAALDAPWGIVDAPTREGLPSRVAFSRSPKYGWHFAIGVPKSELAAPVYRTVLLVLASGVVLLAVGAALALRIGRGLAAAIATLLPGPDGGRRPARAPTGVLEVDAVARGLDRAEAALRAAKEESERANVAKSQFLASASHDLRQPVQSLFFVHDVLAAKLRNHPCAAMVANMQSALDALKSLLDALLDISLLHAGTVEARPRPFPVSDLLDAALAEQTAHAASRRVALRLVRCSAWVRSDRAQLLRILRNLLDNAVKYTAPGGTVLLGCRRAGGDLLIQVVDTGIGIPPDQQAAVFEEFVQLGNPERDRARGLGLGLAVVRHLGILLGHAITVRSRLGHGTAFTVRLPRAQPQPEAVAAASTA